MGILNWLEKLPKLFGVEAAPKEDAAHTFKQMPEIGGLTFLRAVVDKPGNHIDVLFFAPEMIPPMTPIKQAVLEFVPADAKFDILIAATMDESFDYLSVRLHPSKENEGPVNMGAVAYAINQGIKAKYAPSLVATDVNEAEPKPAI